MRIEQQGHIEVQPTYQHVGYVSAGTEVAMQAMRSDLLHHSTHGALLRAGGGLLLAVLALVCLRRCRSLAIVAVPSCVVAAALLAWPLLGGRALDPRLYHTLRGIEEATALTDAWAAEHGRVPTEEEWASRMSGRPCSRNGWGHPLRYSTVERNVGDPLPPYRIATQIGEYYGNPGTDGGHWLSYSDGLGQDAVFGTPDDHDWLLGSVSGDWTIPGRYAHGREPRR